MTSLPYQQQWIDRGTDRLGLQWYEPPADPAATTVLICPAMGVPARFYRPFATSLRAAGLAVVVADLRGTGASTPRPSRRSRYGYADLVADVGEVTATVRRQRPDDRLVLIGHSLGGQLGLLQLALTQRDRAAQRGGAAQRDRATQRDRTAHPDGALGGNGATGVDALALVGTGLPYWRAYPGPQRYTVLAFTQAIHATTALLRVWPGWGFGGRQARQVIHDWAFTARVGRFPTLSGVDPEAALAAVRTPVLAVSFERDQYVPAPAVDYLVDKLPAGGVQREHFDGGADHFNWARFDGGPLVERIAEFASRP